MDDHNYEELLTRGYNAGYLLSRYEPILYQQVIAGADKSKPYFAGMIEGHRAAEREVFQQGLENSRKTNASLRPKP